MMANIIDLVEKTSPQGVDYQLETCLLETSSQIIDDPRQVRQEVLAFAKKFPKANGWLCFQSAVRHFTDGNIPDSGLIQYGELGADEQGLLIRRAPRGKWRMVTLQEGRGQEMIVQTCRHVGRRDLWDNQPFNLVYRRYWTVDDQCGCMPLAARFVAFESAGGDL